MGYIKHNAIICTNYLEGPELEKAHEYAKELKLNVSEIIDSHINGFQSFFIAPDGSKEGWQTSDEFDEKRKKFKEYLRSRSLSLRSGYIHWIEIKFGGDEPEICFIVDHYAKED